MIRTSSLLLTIGLSLLLSSGAFATPMTASFSYLVSVPDDDSGILPDVTATFSWDDTCDTSCTLQIDLVYHDVGGNTTAAQALAGVTWDTVGAIVVDPTASAVLAPTLVGSQSATAIADLGSTTIDGVTGTIVTPHWAFRDDLNNASDPMIPIEWDLLGDYVISSVGGVTSDATGIDHLFPGIPSSVESPTDGAPFTIVDPNTTSVVGNNGDVALAQGSSTAFLIYNGTLSDIENVAPLFGTDGYAVVPEPTTGLLLGLGLVGIGGIRRRNAR
jgi:hypothetical protein